jgi:copper oxidase (laccase) domain-containing protein
MIETQEESYDQGTKETIKFDPENPACDLLTPSQLDRYAEDGLIFAMSPARSGNMTFRPRQRINGEVVIEEADPQEVIHNRRSFLQAVERKFHRNPGTLDLNQARRIEPFGFGPQLIKDHSLDGQIIHGAESAIFQNEGFATFLPADCLPVFMYSPQTQTLALLHGSFQAINKDIGTQTVTQMTDIGVNPADIRVVIGPGVGSWWYQRPYIITNRPDIWEGSVAPWEEDSDQLLQTTVHVQSDEAQVFYPASSYKLGSYLKNASDRTFDSYKQLATELHQVRKDTPNIPKLALDTHYPLIKQLVNTGVLEANIEIDPADTYQNSKRNLLFSHQGFEREETDLRGNALALFGRITK